MSIITRFSSYNHFRCEVPRIQPLFTVECFHENRQKVRRIGKLLSYP